MTLREIARKVANQTHLPKKQTEYTIEKCMEVIAEEVAKGNPVKVVPLGIFSRRFRSSRKCANPLKPSETITNPDMYIPKFSPSITFKRIVKQHSNESNK